MAVKYVANGSQDALFGNSEISRYLGICVGTLGNWRKRHAFPAAPMPDGRIMTTKSLIDQWILSRHDAVCRKNQSPGRPKKSDTNNQELTSDS